MLTSYGELGVRYSFHGKVRATGQQVDGYVEAETSTEAIDRLADQGIIGVYSVRAEPKQPRNPVLLAGTPEFERSLYEEPNAAGGNRKARKALPGPQQMPMQVPYLPPVPLPEPVQPPAPMLDAAPAAPVPVVVTGGISDNTMLALVDKLGTLIGQMQKFLERPAQVVYASGPAREGKGGGGKRSASRNISDAQNSTLKDIFLNNLDLRRSLQKLADTVTPSPNGSPAPDAVLAEPAAAEASSLAEAPAVAEEPAMIEASVEPEPAMLESAPAEAVAEVSNDESGGDLPILAYDDDHAHQAQPAA